jgi:hypothetical protein
MIQYGGQGNPQSWKLGKRYMDSFAELPNMDAVVSSLRVPLLLIHGEDDK